MVESLKELNKIVQKPDYRKKGNWMARYIVRDAALPITRLLLHTRVTANQVTLISVLVGLVGIGAFALTPRIFFLFGAFLLQLWYLLDHVDGQIARYRGTVSLSGRFFDFITHHLIHGVLFFALGFYMFNITGAAFFLLWGFVSSLSIMMFNLSHDAKYKTFFEKLTLGTEVDLEKEEESLSSDSKEGDKPRDWQRTLFSSLHKICEIHVVMNVLTGAAILECTFMKGLDFRILLFIMYGLITPVIAIVKLTYIISRKKIDQEYDQFIQPRN